MRMNKKAIIKREEILQDADQDILDLLHQDNEALQFLNAACQWFVESNK